MKTNRRSFFGLLLGVSIAKPISIPAKTDLQIELEKMKCVFTPHVHKAMIAEFSKPMVIDNWQEKMEMWFLQKYGYPMPDINARNLKTK